MYLFLGYIIGFISSLGVFYITTNIKEVKEQKIIFHKLSLEIRDLLLQLTGLKSSCDQFLKSCIDFKDNKISSIGFPIYIFPQIKHLIPFSLYGKNNKFLLNQIIELDRLSYSLNNFTRDLYINEIKEHLLSGKISKDETINRYLNEGKIIKEYLKEIDNYIEITFTILSAIEIINENNSEKKLFLFELNTNYSDQELLNKINKVKKYFYNSFSTIEDVTLPK